VIDLPVYRETRYNIAVIISFRDEETRKVFSRQWSTRLPRDIQTVAYRKLAMLHAANALINLQSPPGNRLEKLRGDRAGLYSIRINERWRICFEWHETDAHNVEIVDYHS
jgi:toxin HigB-1